MTPGARTNPRQAPAGGGALRPPVGTDPRTNPRQAPAGSPDPRTNPRQTPAAELESVRDGRGFSKPQLLTFDEQGFLENQLARTGGFPIRVYGSEQLRLFEAYELYLPGGGRIEFLMDERYRARYGSPSFVDMKTMVALTTLWALLEPDERRSGIVRTTLAEISRILYGSPHPNGRECRRLRESLWRLATVSIVRPAPGHGGELRDRVYSFIAEASFLSQESDEEWDGETTVWIRFDPSYLASIGREFWTYALDRKALSLMSPLAARCYLFLAAQAPTRENGKPYTELSFPAGRALYENLGLMGESFRPAERREAIERAFLEVARLEPIYLGVRDGEEEHPIGWYQKGRRGQRAWWIRIRRLNSPSRAAARRREVAEREAEAGGLSPAELRAGWSVIGPAGELLLTRAEALPAPTTAISAHAPSVATAPVVGEQQAAAGAADGRLPEPPGYRAPDPFTVYAVRLSASLIGKPGTPAEVLAYRDALIAYCADRTLPRPVAPPGWGPDEFAPPPRARPRER